MYDVLDLVFKAAIAVTLWKILEHVRRPSNSKPNINLGDFKLMIIVRATSPDGRYAVTLPTEGTDAEGNPVTLDPAKFSVSITSDNPSAIEIIPDDDGDDLTGIVHVGTPQADGSPSMANVNAVLSYDGEVVGSFGQQFTVVAGDIEHFVGGALEVTGLDEVPQDEEPTDEEPEG